MCVFPVCGGFYKSLSSHKVVGSTEKTYLQCCYKSPFKWKKKP